MILAQRMTVPVVYPEVAANLVPRYALEAAAWIWHTARPSRETAVLTFLNDFTVVRPETVRVHVSADQRYVLSLDGQVVSLGPDRSDEAHWSFASYDLALTPGAHRLEATVWWIGAAAPGAQLSYCGGFIFAAEGAWGARLDSGRGPWQVIDRSNAWTFENRPGEQPASLVGAHQTVHGTRWFASVEPVQPAIVVGPLTPAEWATVRPGWRLRPSPLPDQVRCVRRPGQIVAVIPGGLDGDTPLRAEHLTHPEVTRWQRLLSAGGIVTVPPETTVSVLWSLDGYWCGYSQATLTGGADSEVSLTWVEALFERPLRDCSKHKGDRRVLVGKFVRGLRDSFRTDGGVGRNYTACWWRAGCHILVTVRTAREPLTVADISLRETRYPLVPDATFDSDSADANRIVPFAVRGLQMCAHETLMDCPHYEQLHYSADARIQALCGYVLTRDDRLARRSIELFDWSRRYFGFTNSAYPAGPQLISTFPLYWVLMVHDYAWWRDDPAFVRARLPGVRTNLDAMGELCSPDGLLGALPGWAFVDTVPEWIDTVYAPDSRHGPSSLVNLLHVLALRQAGDLEEWALEPELAARWRSRAETIARSVHAACWDESRALMADYPDRSAWSEHAQILALLADALPREQAQGCLATLLSADSLARAQPMYWMFYLFDLFQKMNCGERMLAHLGHWSELIAHGLHTPCEMFEPSRSDCHAWGSHPLFHLHATLAGIRPDAPGFRRVRIAPAPGNLRRLHSRLPHPRGFVEAELDFPVTGACRGRITLPEDVTGSLVWHGQVVPLAAGEQRIACSAEGRA